MISFNDLKELCTARRSIRYFDVKPVDQKEIEQLLELAVLSPSVQNTQPWRFHVITNQAMKEELMKSSAYGNFVAGASAFIILCADQTAKKETSEVVWNPRELEYSCVAAMQNMILGATTMGLGTCWITMHHGVAHELLKLPTNELVVGGLMIGHMRRGEEEPSGAHIRKDLSEVVKWH